MEKDLQINILPIENSKFTFSLYSKVYPAFEKNPLVYFTRINEEIYGVSISAYEDFKRNDFDSFDSTELTKWYLYNLLKENCKRNSISYNEFDKFQRYIDIKLNEDDFGQEIVTITPTYVNSKKVFGFMLNYRFIKNKNVSFSREIQIRSLSLDRNGNENKNYYIDKYNKITSFIKKYYQHVFSFNDLTVSQSFLKITSSTLETKKYLFGNSNINNSQFQGIKNFGPYLPINTTNYIPKICFIYRNNEKNYSYKLYHALFGKTYPTFSGMEKMFHFALNKDSVLGEGITDYSVDNIKIVIQHLKEKYPEDFIVPVLIVPWSKESASEEQEKLYFELKHLFLINNMASQFISIDKIINDNILKWSVSSLAIQIFSKLGGSPWVVIPKTSNCLIIGIGQAYQQHEDSSIKKFFSYSILTDTTGLFKGIRILANTNNKEDYAKNLAKSLKEIINRYSNNYDSFVIHTSFRISKKDIKIIKSVLDEIKENSSFNFAILRFDDTHDYLCFDTSFNSLVPLESTKVELSCRNYLVWFEGQQYGQFTIRHRIGSPIRVIIDYPKDINRERITDYLQDAINLSGANWRGFNAKSIPVSLLYAQLISHFISEFDKYNLGTINIENLMPWFL